MSNLLVWTLATFITVPILGFYFIYLISIKTTKNKKRSVKLAVDASSILFIFAVYYIAYEIWGMNILWVIITIFIVIAILFTFIHWKVSEDIHLYKLIKGIWRFNFLLFFAAYFLLSMYGLFVRIFFV